MKKNQIIINSKFLRKWEFNFVSILPKRSLFAFCIPNYFKSACNYEELAQMKNELKDFTFCHHLTRFTFKKNDVRIGENAFTRSEVCATISCHRGLSTESYVKNSDEFRHQPGMLEIQYLIEALNLKKDYKSCQEVFQKVFDLTIRKDRSSPKSKKNEIMQKLYKGG